MEKSARRLLTMLTGIAISSAALTTYAYDPNPPAPTGIINNDKIILRTKKKGESNRPKAPAMVTLTAEYNRATGTMTFLIDDEEGRIAYEVTGTAGDYRIGEVTFSDPSAELNLSPDSYAIQCTDQNGTLYYGEFELTAE